MLLHELALPAACRCKQQGTVLRQREEQKKQEQLEDMERRYHIAKGHKLGTVGRLTNDDPSRPEN